MADYWTEYAWFPDGPVGAVRLSERYGRWEAITTGVPPGPGDIRLPGVAFPGFANCHSHAFHRALRGRAGGRRTQSFWDWRATMYRLAERLDPDSYLALARACYAEMALSGVTAVGEFHYLHHDIDGRPYADPNAFAAALRQAAVEAGVRLTLLDTCYLTGGLTADGYQPLRGAQLRFGDQDVGRWVERVAALADDARTRIGYAIHSVRAVPTEHWRPIIEAAGDRPLHLHLSEQPAENAAALAFHGATPTRLLADSGALGRSTTAVHAIHITEEDRHLLGTSGTWICCCPTTEGDLGDGIGPAYDLNEAGSPLSLGSDQHAVIDIFTEMQALQRHQRLRSGLVQQFTPSRLVAAATAHPSIGWPDAGRFGEGDRADLVAVRTDSHRTAGADPEQLISAATASDVHTVIADGAPVVQEHRHRLGDVGRLLSEAVDRIWRAR
jgi:formiminoglutamate deiminase